MLTLPTQSNAVAVATQQLRIIVADDVDEIRMLMGKWLENDGHAVSYASTGEQVVRLLHHHPYDMVITDVLMPDGDGLDVIHAARRVNPVPRVLAISGGGRYMGAQDCLRIAHGIGADGVLLKPFNHEELVAAMQQVLSSA
jgi:CheY-like chemotaxis protein